MTSLTIDNERTLSGDSATVLAGRYRIVRELGQGGMGSVWLAEDTVLDHRKVAIKMLPSVLCANKRAYNQLKSEALVAMKLSHPNIAAVRSFEENNGNPFIVEDYVDGRTLDDYLAEKGGTLTEDETRKLLAPIAAALDYAHGKGVVHRDVKPGNVMIATDETPYVLDFGIAREAQETMTMVTGKLSSGTLLYMSPEQLNGAMPEPAQDVYSFAAMVYECFAGQPPFCRGQIEYQIVNNLPPPLGPQFAICGPVMDGLAKEPADRPATCSAVLKGGASGAPRANPHGVSSRKQFPLVALVMLLLAATVGGLFAWRAHERSITAGAREAERKARAQKEAEQREAGRKAAEEAGRQDNPSVQLEAEARRQENAEYNRLLVLLRVKVSQAKSSYEALEPFRSEPDGFAAHLAKAEAAYKAVDWSAKPADREAAEALLKRSGESSDVLMVELDWLKANKAGRDAARAADTLIEKEILPKADKAGAADYATVAYRTASNLRTRAKREFADGAFAEAAATYAEARRTFEAAADEAVRHQFKTALAAAETAKAENAWSICLGEVEKALAWSPNDEKALALQREAASHLEPKVEPGDTKTVMLPGGTKLELVYCPPGEFMMGSPETEKGHADKEKLHRVTLTNGFWIGKYEVTQAQWKSVMGGNPSTFKGDDRPVECVSWHDCQAFLKKSGLGLRLPTEAEWEYACRAGSTGSYAGAGKLSGMGWYINNSRNATHSVGQKQPNDWGLYDMHGNVWEWCQDFYGPYTTDARDPRGPASGDTRVVRSGGWASDACYSRTAYRDGDNPGLRDDDLGFRVAASVWGSCEFEHCSDTNFWERIRTLLRYQFLGR